VPDEKPANASARNPLGSVGRYVIENLKQLREERRLAYTELSARLEQLGRPIPTLGLSRIENGKRRVDADDLVALAIALGVNPSALLLPRSTGAEDEIELSPATRHLAWIVWQWADGQEPLPERNTPESDWVARRTSLPQVIDFMAYARPAWKADVPQMNATVTARIEELEKQVQELHKSGAGRSSATQEEQQPVVAAIVTSSEGVLIARRNDGSPPWTFIAGEVEPGELPEDAAVREVKEETGCRVRVGELIGERVHPVTGRTMIYMAARPTHGTDIFVGDEAELAEVRWVGQAEAVELLPGMYEPVREYLSRELASGEQQ
jgi:8-oxo-dGTP pyrophosphatase MutT (NUDIX family)/transcriptional regulator with XRE-family HTH domain